MDIELPNGQVITDVPEGTPKEAIMQKAISSGLATAEDFGQQLMTEEQFTERSGDIPDIYGEIAPQAPKEEPSFGEKAIGAGEAALTTATGMTGGAIGMIGGSLQGIIDEIRTGEFGSNEAANRIEKKAMDLMAKLTYQPKTETGQGYVESIGEASQSLAPLAGLSGPIQQMGQAARVGGAVSKPKAVKQAKPITSKESAALSKASPEVNTIKKTARNLYKEIDDTGAKVDQSDFLDFAIKAEDIAKKSGFDPELTPKSNALLKRISRDLDKDMSITDIDQLRKVSQIAASSFDNPTDSAIGSKIIDALDDFLDGQGAKIAAKGGADVGKKYRQARDLWARAKKSEIIDEAMLKAENQASGFENGIRTQFRSILNNKKKRKGFNRDELAAMNKVVQGGTAENLLKTLGKLGFTEGQRTNVLTGLAGIGAGGAVGGTFGAVAVPAIGQVSMKLAQKLTRKNSKFAQDIVKSGKNGQDIVKAYMRNVPKDKRSTAELTELLMRPDVDIDSIKSMGGSQKIINDAVFYASELRDAKDAGLMSTTITAQELDKKQQTQ